MMVLIVAEKKQGRKEKKEVRREGGSKAGRKEGRWKEGRKEGRWKEGKEKKMK
jgi:hypothetical protein